MSDWEFLYDMKNQGYGKNDIMNAMATGASPQDWAFIEKKMKLEEFKSSKEDIEDLKLLKATRNDEKISFEDYLKNEN